MGLNKLSSSAIEAVADVARDGMTIAVGGFGLCGVPYGLIDALRQTRVKDLVIVSNNMCVDGVGLGVLLEQRQVRKVIASYVGENHVFQRQYLAGLIEVEFSPQGTLAERLRAGGAGIPAFYTRSGAGTAVADGKPTADFDGQTYLLERGIVADLALVHAYAGDAEGNLRYRYTAQNFNPLVAAAGRTTIAEAETLLTETFLDPETVKTPGIFVDRVVRADPRVKPIEKCTVRPVADCRDTAV
jgi:3-oxoacid CoA-transferase subunit A